MVMSSSYVKPETPARDNNKNVWRKILYRRQGVEDNYVDESFLSTLNTNLRTPSYSYWHLVFCTGCVTQHVSCVAIFLGVWNLIRCDLLEAEGYVILVDLAMLPVSFAHRLITGSSFSVFCSAVKRAAVVFGALWILSPVLLTLTKTFSDDTVATLTTLFLILHMALFDYSTEGGALRRGPPCTTNCMSFNAAMFAAILMASRLDSATEVFAFVFFGIEVFGLSPLARHCIWQRSEKFYIYVLGSVLFGVGFFMLRSVSNLAANLYVLGMFFMTFVSPLWLIRSQRLKNDLRGPWDTVDVRTYH